MPKIVIREIDNTKAGGAAYANFSVVVPGLVDTVKDTSTVFDENGVYECSNKDDFVDKIGLVAPQNRKISDAVAPTWNTTNFSEGPSPLTLAEFNNYLKTGKLYVAHVNAPAQEGEAAREIGYLVDSAYVYKLAKEAGVTNETYVFLSEASPATPASEEPEPEPGEGTSEPETPAEPETPVEYTQFVVLDTLGADAVYGDHYGNQMAFELLCLGYTVLYKKIDTVLDLADSNFWKPLKDRAVYDFRYIVSGLINGNSTVYKNMVDLASFVPETSDFDGVGVTTHGRGDCIALLDIDEEAYLGKSQEEAITSVLEFTDNVSPSKYAAAFLPTVKYKSGSLHADVDTKFGGNTTFPASFHYLACAARSAEHFNEWYANAGYTRGISNLLIDTTTCKFGEAAVNMFQKRAADTANNVSLAINPIINLRGSYYIWGNRTTLALGDPKTAEGDLKASHFLNIRQLCCTIKKKVYVACRQLTFDPNSNVLWDNFCNSIKPLLEKMKADQGIADYKISKVKTNRKAFLAASIRIVPIEAVEDFDISIYLEDSLNGIIATAEE